MKASKETAAALIQGVGSVIGTEGEQVGWFRAVQGKRPTAEPFDTAAAREFALTALKGFVAPGTSCPSIDSIQFSSFAPLTVMSTEICDGPIQFSATNGYGTTVDPSKQSLVYMNGALEPIVVDFTAETNGDQVTISADFPQKEKVLEGLTIAAIVNGKGPFMGSDDVAKAAVFGPGLIESEITQF